MYTHQSPYQRIVVTKWNEDIRLFIDGNLQFSTRDEFRYHESLVHIPMALTSKRQNVLILGGGDGLVAREVLKYPEVEKVVLVDLDPAMTKLGKNHPVFTRLNQASLQNKKVEIINEDAFNFVEKTNDWFNLIIIDLPDPNNHSLGKLYSVEFYQILEKCMAAGAVMVTQSTSPYFAPEAFWCINSSIQEVFPKVIPYHTYVPTFGEWGFNLATGRKTEEKEQRILDRESSKIAWDSISGVIGDFIISREAQLSLRFLHEEHLTSFFQFDRDTRLDSIPPNRIQDQSLVKIYEDSWESWR